MSAGIKAAVEEQFMPTKTPRKNAGAIQTGDGKARTQRKAVGKRDKAWDERLRLVGDARFVEIAWSGRDNPSWPLPRT